MTAPSLHFAITQACRFGAAPRKSHYKAALRILRYAIDNVDKLRITYDRTLEHTGMYGFSDSEFASLDTATRRSFYGYVIYFCGAPITWACKQNKRATRGTAQAEYYALSFCADEVMAMRQFLTNIGYEEQLGGPTTIYCDNQSAIGNANGTMNPKGSKHIEMSYHLVRDYIEYKDVDVVFLPTALMVADIFTKSLLEAVFKKHAMRIQGMAQQR